MTFTNRLRSEQERAFIHSKLLASASQPTPGGGGEEKRKLSPICVDIRQVTSSHSLLVKRPPSLA